MKFLWNKLIIEEMSDLWFYMGLSRYKFGYHGKGKNYLKISFKISNLN